MGTLGIRVSAAGASGMSARIDALAHNLANAATPGFRRADVSFRAELDGALGLEAPRLDGRGGGFEATGRPLDLALRTPGWFAVADPSTNETLYTRAGNFALAADGRLTTADGRRHVLGDDGRGIASDPAAGAIRTGEDGRLFQGEVAIGQLGIWGIGDETRLHGAGEGLYRNGGSGAALAAEARVSPGTLERSSVDPVSEMVGLLRAFRALEANLEAMRLQDGALGRALESAARPVR
jgi:flagellar basal-body rod protein FlgF